MSLKRMESCDISGVAGEKWASFGSITFNDTESGRTCWQINQNIGSAAVCALGVADDEIIVGVRYMWSTVGDGNQYSISFIGDSGTTHLTIRPGSTGTVRALRANLTQIAISNTNVWTVGQWFYLEVHVRIHDTLGFVIMRVNGVEVCNVTGWNTRGGGAVGEIDTVAFGSPGGSVVTHMRDIVIMNGVADGDGFNTFIGPVAIQARVANGAGNYAEWTPNTGTNQAAVDDSPTNDGDTTYVESTVAGDRDSYTFPDFTLSGDPIAVSAFATARYVTAPFGLAMFIRRGTDADAAVKTPGGSYGSRGYTYWVDDPVAAAAWTLANLNASEIGILSVTP